MSGHAPTDLPNERSNPFLWAAALTGFIAVATVVFLNMIDKGRDLAEAHPLPEIEDNSGPFVPDHAAMIDAVMSADADLVAEGQKLYAQNCTSCHGQDGGMPQAAYPTARQFINQAMQNEGDDLPGAHPYRIYATLSQGYGAGMVAQFANDERGANQRYAVIAYMRETFFKDQNPSQYITDVDTSSGPWPAPAVGGGDDEGPRGVLADMRLEIPVTGAMAAEAADAADATIALASLGAGSDAITGTAGEALRLAAEQPANGALAIAMVAAAEAGDQEAFLTAASSHNQLRKLALLDQTTLASVLSAIASAQP